MTARNRRAGQIIVVFAGGLVAFVGLAALAIDLSSVASLQRTEKSAADSAALAGAQDLQTPDSRTGGDPVAARQHALANLAGTFAVAVPGGLACSPAADITDCPLAGTPYHVAIKTPSPSFVHVTPSRAVQVTVTNPDVPLTFARIFGQHDWRVSQTSVAGLDFGRAYAVVTLRPPQTAGSGFDVKDIWVKGGSVVNVLNGDVGTNANMEYDGLGTGSILNISPGYSMAYHDPYFPPLWYPTAPKPPAQEVDHITQLIQDPGYLPPAMSGSLGTAASHTFSQANESSCVAAGVNPACSQASLDPACLTEAQTKVDASRYSFMTGALTDPTTIYCYNPGIYLTSNSNKPSIANGHVGILLPGAYYFKSGLSVSGWLIGGYEPGHKGVVLMFDEDNNQNILNANNAVALALNAGTRFPPSYSGGTPALAAHDWNDQPVETTGPSAPTPHILITLYVNRDPACIVQPIEPLGCDDNHNATINMAGGGLVALEGVQYAPSDNVKINGGSSGNGRVGQIISWTLFYSGGTHINQEGASSAGEGVLHLDEACSGGGTPCTP